MQTVVRLIFTGLITLASTEDGQSIALMLDKSFTHRASVVLIEGECAGEECGDPEGPFTLVWDLETLEDGVEVELVDGGSNGPLTRAAVPATAGPPTTPGHAAAAGWIVSLTETSEVRAAEEEPTEDFRPAESTEREEASPVLPPKLDHVEAIFRTSRSRVLSNCRFVHDGRHTRSLEESCKDYRATDRLGGTRTLPLFRFVDPTANCCATHECTSVHEGRQRAISDAFMIEYTVPGRGSLKLRRTLPDGTPRDAPIRPQALDESTAAVTLAFVNVADLSDRRPTKPHCHFRLHFSVGGSREFVPQRVPGQTVEASPGVCEPYVECLEAVFNPQPKPPKKGDFKPLVAHMLSQCDVATYP